MPPNCASFQNHSGRPLPPPGQSAALHDLVRRDVDGLDYLADRALLDQFASIHRGAHLQPFRIEDGIDAPCFGDGLAHQRQVFQRGDAGLVGQKILARFHDTHTDPGPLASDMR